MVCRVFRSRRSFYNDSRFFAVLPRGTKQIFRGNRLPSISIQYSLCRFTGSTVANWTFCRRCFSFTYFFRSFCLSHCKLITGIERVVNVYIRVYARCALIGRFLTARSEGCHSKFIVMRAGSNSTSIPSDSERAR